MACADLLNELRNIVVKLGEVKAAVMELHNHFMVPHRLDVLKFQRDGWEEVRSGTTIIYSKEVTLAGATQTETLSLSQTLFLFQHIYMSFNSANARTYNIRQYNAKNIALYTTLDSVTGHTSDSRIVQLGVEHRTRSHKLEWNFSAYTVGDIINIEVAVEEQ